VSRGTAVRCAKKRVNLINDARIKVCTQRFDSHVLLCVAGDEYYLCSRKKYLYFVFGDLTYFHVGLPEEEKKKNIYFANSKNIITIRS